MVRVRGYLEPNPNPNPNPNPHQVTTTDGHAYERREIFRWLCTHNTSPLTGSVLPNKFLTPALALKQLIAAFKAEHPELVDSLV